GSWRHSPSRSARCTGCSTTPSSDDARPAKKIPGTGTGFINPYLSRVFSVRELSVLLVDGLVGFVARDFENLDAVAAVHLADRRTIVDREHHALDGKGEQQILFRHVVLALVTRAAHEQAATGHVVLLQ